MCIRDRAKVVNRLAQQGIKKTDLTRDEFLKHAWEWKEEHGGITVSYTHLDVYKRQTQSAAVKDEWKYASIAKLNYILEGIEKAKDQISEEEYLRFNAEVRFIRAFVYYDMVFFFGDVPVSYTHLDVYKRQIQEVADRAGFSSARYFSTAFKQSYGMTPTEYRRNN